MKGALAGDVCAAIGLVLNGEAIIAEPIRKVFLAAMDGVFATII